MIIQNQFTNIPVGLFGTKINKKEKYKNQDDTTENKI